MRKENSIDKLFENLVEQFSKIRNFELTQTDPLGNKLFNFVVKLVSEFDSYQKLFVQYYVPASKKSTIAVKKEIKHSKYKKYFHITEEELNENYYETIRLGYVGAYHKYESYIKRLPVLMDEFFKELDFDNNFIPIKDYLKKEFDIELRKTIYNFPITYKVNWICNCVKHKDGYPLKEPIPSFFKHLNSSKKIQLESKEFKSDMEELIIHNNLILQTFFIIGFYQYLDQEGAIKELKPKYQEQGKMEALKNHLNSTIKIMFNAT
ncbi:hypothetical protein [uncultured Aquimarina sp.]|uniref:hypothetical protein n=1 Tax=uncultured Aquimarina sp. TaxID=575652 RepID=UPI0026211078|nr:hypothetical protein [uncultured Aquimarina sp.]